MCWTPGSRPARKTPSIRAYSSRLIGSVPVRFPARTPLRPPPLPGSPDKPPRIGRGAGDHAQAAPSPARHRRRSDARTPRLPAADPTRRPRCRARETTPSNWRQWCRHRARRPVSRRSVASSRSSCISIGFYLGCSQAGQCRPRTNRRTRAQRRRPSRARGQRQTGLAGRAAPTSRVTGCGWTTIRRRGSSPAGSRTSII